MGQDINRRVCSFSVMAPQREGIYNAQRLTDLLFVMQTVPEIHDVYHIRHNADSQAARQRLDLSHPTTCVHIIITDAHPQSLSTCSQAASSGVPRSLLK
ncbi:hypothetical protein D3C79_945660 [compost metagenome]